MRCYDIKEKAKGTAFMESIGRGGRRHANGAVIVMRDVLVLMTLLLCVALVYRIAPQSLCGASGVTVGKEATQNAAAGTIAADRPATSAVTEAPQLPTAAQSVPAEIPPTAAQSVPAEIPSVAAAPASVVGDFSAVFPSTDTGVNALHSYQSDSMRIAIHKIAENGVTYFVADVWVKNIESFRTVLAKGEYGRNFHELPAKMAKDSGATFAVSGDYYGARDKGVVIRNGVLYRDVMNDDVCILKTDGTLAVYGASEFSSLQSLDETVWQAWAFGPALVKDGAACDTSASKIKVKNPRCAIGCYEPGHYCFIVADGRQDGYSSGMTLNELSSTFVSLGCKVAYNLDGGATAMMVFRGEVVNHPTKGGRASSDIICF